MIHRAVVVGLGSIGLRHLRLLREALPEADILVLRHHGCGDPLPHAARCTTSLEEACAFNPEVAVIASPAPFHMETAGRLAEQGTDLLLEKPLAATLDGVEAFLETCKKNGVLVQVGYNLRLLETLRTFREELNNGRIGKIHAVRCEIGQYLPEWRPGKDYRQTVSAQRKLGGGVLLELSHELDMLRWVFGDVEWVSSWTATLGSLEVDVEDSAHLTLGFSSGVLGNLCMDFLRRDTTRYCTAIGETGTLRWDALAGNVSLFSAETNQWRTLFERPTDRDGSYREQIKVFLEAVSQGRASTDVAMGEDGLEALRLVSAARKSGEARGQATFVAKGTET